MSLATSSPEVEAAASRFRGFFNELGRTFVERDDLLAQIGLALLSREHVLMTGPPGTAKSGVAAAVLGRIVDEKTGKPSVFARQFTESTVQTDLVGPIDFKTLMQTGRTEHFTDEGMLGAVHAFLDEVLDGRDMLLRTTLNVLQERELKQGTKTTAGAIECALMTTNRYLAEVLEGSRETLLAFVDRIAFVSFVPKGFSDGESLGRVVRSQIGGSRRPLTSLLTIQDLDVLQAIADSVVVGDEVCAALVTLLEHLDADLATAAKHDPTFQPTRYLSTRTAVRLGRILRAICVYDAIMNKADRVPEADHRDLGMLRLSVLLSGPSFATLPKLVEKETDPRERRQLSILRTEREIFDRALARVPKPAPKAGNEKKPESKLEAQMEKAIPAASPKPLLDTAVALARASDAGGPGADQARALLDTTLSHLAERALRAGATAGASPEDNDVINELSTLADGLEKASGATRPVARWLRGRAIRILLDTAALSVSTKGADDALVRLEKIFAQCAALRAAGADLPEPDLAEKAQQTAVARAEDELVEACDAAFRAAVANTLKRVGNEQLGVLLATLGPALEAIDAQGARLGALGGRADSLKARIVAPRIEPLVSAAFTRVNAVDRMDLIDQVGKVIDRLQESNLRSVLPKQTILRFAIEALVRSEQGKRGVSFPVSYDHDSYRTHRSAEQRVSLAYTTTELALRITPDKPPIEGSAAALVAGIHEIIASLPENLRHEVVALDIARIDRAVTFVESWWKAIGKQVAAESAADGIKDIGASKFFDVTRNEGALLRFALEARVVAEVFPEAADKVTPLRARIDALEEGSSKALAALRLGRADAAWTELPRSPLDVIERIDAILRGPDAIASQTFFRVVRPLLALTGGWRAQLQTKATLDLVVMLHGTRDWDEIRKQLVKAEKELEANVTTLERVTIVRKLPPFAHVMWLRRVVSVLELAKAAANANATPDEIRAATKGDPALVLPPLTPLRDGNAKEVEDSRLVDLELAAIDHLMAAARAETLVLGRRRRLLLAARQRLLEASAALPLERMGVSDRARWLAMEVTRIDRLEASGVAADVSLVHQMRQALMRRDSKKLYGSLSALDANALRHGDREIWSRTGKLLDQFGEREARASAEQSAKELLGANVMVIADAVAEARSDAQAMIDTTEAPHEKRAAARTFLQHLPEDAGISITNAALTVDGFFEVGGALSPVRITEESFVQRVVKHPTQELTLLPAEDVNDLKDAIIGDPRAILLDLAIGRLFARRFVRDEPIRRHRIVLHGEVRVYVLDGSGSMLGKRARVRDAILIAELSTLMKRLENPRDVRCTLFYRYFDEQLGPQNRVETAKEAQGAIRDIVRTDRQGGTDIQLALVSSLEQIALTRAGDPELARAQVVLITDGESDIDEATIVGAREKIGGIPVGVSVIALGAENAALRGLVARQRAKGEAAFYHYLDDDDCDAIIDGTVAGRAIHAPDKWEEMAEDPRALEEELGGLVDELEAIDKQRDVDALERLEEEAQARRDMGLEAEEAENQGERARVEALRKDRVALGARFARWFPRVEPAGDEVPDEAREDVDAVTCALASVAEVVGLLSGSEFARQADAIELLERLLPDAQLTPGRYRAIVRDYPTAIAPGIKAIYAAIRSKAE